MCQNKDHYHCNNCNRKLHCDRCGSCHKVNWVSYGGSLE